MSSTPPGPTSDPAPAPKPEAAPSTSPAAAAAPASAAPAVAPPAAAPAAAAPAAAPPAAPAELSEAQAAKAAAIAKAKAAQAAKAAAATAAPAAAPAAAAPAPAKPAAPVPAAAPAAAAPPAEKITIDIDKKTLGKLVKAAGALFGVLVILNLLFGGLSLYLLIRMGETDPVPRVVKQIPGMDGNKEQIEKPLAAKDTGKKSAAVPKEGAGTSENPPKDDEGPAIDDNEPVKIGETFQAFDGKAADLPGVWSTFRGGLYDNISPETKLLDRWPAGGPKVLWELRLGEGYAGVAVNKGRVYLLDYDEATKEEGLRCFSLADGKEIWRRSYKVRIVRNHGITRTVPAVTDKYVVTVGPRCHVMCVDATTGDLKWGIDLCKTYGSKVPVWYTAQCPVIDGGVAVIAPASPEALMIGVDLETGQVKWKAPNPKGWRMSHSSIIPMTLNGRRMFVYAAVGGIAAFAADGPEPGKKLWESLEWSSVQVISPSPLILDDGYVFMTAGYGAGSFLMKVTPEGDAFTAKTVWKLAVKDGLACEQQTPIYYNKKIYSMNPADSGARKDQLVCMDPYQNGKILWSSGKEKRYGHYEPFFLADGKLWVVGVDGQLSIVQATHEGFKPLSEAKLLKDDWEAWAPIALAGGRMILRDKERMVCVNVAQGGE